MFGKRILILVPHPDDEIVAACAAIEHVQKDGSEVFTLYLTHGCIARETSWPWDRKRYPEIVERRRLEGEKAAKFLGVRPCGWSVRPARHLWQELPSVYTEVQTAIVDNQIDQLWVPAYEGGNADHDATNAIGYLLKSHLSVLEFAEYNFAKGRAHSQEFPTVNGSEQTIELSTADKLRKRAALDIYESERKNLNYVRTDTECFRPIANYDYAQPPHPGTLWYTRFQWVPFRHPRVDFTKPRDVSAAITAFLNR